MSTIRPAATVVLLRERAGRLEALLLLRNAAVQFAGGLWVFPGGAIDAADFIDDDILNTAKRAAIRETREETGLDIAGCTLQFFAHWTTPEHAVKRYATWFFAAAFPDDKSADGDTGIVVDGGEIVAYRWIDVEQAVALHRAGELEMMPPTFIALHELATCRTLRDVESMYRDRPVIEILPKFIAHGDTTVALYPQDGGYASGDPQSAGKRHRCFRTTDGWHYECDLF